MNIQEDFQEFLRLLTEQHIEFVIVGGYAVAFHGYVRATQGTRWKRKHIANPCSVSRSQPLKITLFSESVGCPPFPIIRSDLEFDVSRACHLMLDRRVVCSVIEALGDAEYAELPVAFIA